MHFNSKKTILTNEIIINKSGQIRILQKFILKDILYFYRFLLTL